MVQAAILIRLPFEKPDAQRTLEDLRIIAKQQDVQVVAEIIDTTVSLVNPQRKDLQQLLRLCRQGAIQKVLISNFTILSSNAIERAQLVEELTQLRVNIYIHNLGVETIDCGSPNVQLLDAFRALAQSARSWQREHRELIVEGIEKARRQGKTIGRPAGSTEGRTAYLKKHALVVRQLRQGLSVRKTAKLCNVAAKTVSKVKAML